VGGGWMQIIEHSFMGTRSAVVRLVRRDAELQFVVLPMLHVASPQFYAEVTERLRRCDLLVLEGMGRSAMSWAITSSYRCMPRNRRSGLVEQRIPYASLGIPLINPDLTGVEFVREWRKEVPRSIRMLVWCAIPFIAVYSYFAGPRRLLSPDIEVNDLPSPAEEIAQDEGFDHLERALGGERDERLLAALSELVRTRADERIDVAIVYGAGHVPTIVRGLYERHGYRPRSAEWITVYAG
jgi:hypothetical protein